MSGRHWGEEKKKVLKKLWPMFRNDEISRDDLEKAFDRTYNGVARMASSLGLDSKDEFVNVQYLKEIGAEIDI